ncbi:replication initiator protein [Microvirus mar29]|uniref:Replication initiator protein n=1 Tax=Microvirus mar29 TaxID=2851162 RepID=A0A8F5RBS2_9VIRU|nr:replication initiator protein [Microvirus mar29]
MPCYYPLKGWVVGRDVATGKKIVKVTSALDVGYPGCESFPVPCGNCIGCRLEYSKQWADRCMLEVQYHERACFITLTYDNDHVPRKVYSSSGGSGPLFALSLSKRDLQLFFKRLRKAFPSCRIRYFGCGEYGPNTLRPHYHVILFGVDFDDKEDFRPSKTLNKMYTSEKLNRIWSFPPRRGESYFNNSPTVAGIATVQPVTWETCAYTARYVTKKLKGPLASFYEGHNMEPPFSCMSRRPGIGRQYYDDHPELWDNDYINVSTPEGGMKFRPPKYFMKLLEQDDPYSAEAMKEVRKAFALQQSLTLEELSQMEHDEYLNRLESIQSAKINTLKRSAV